MMDAAPAKHPNIIHILADDLGYGDVRRLNPDRGKIPAPGMDCSPDAIHGARVCNMAEDPAETRNVQAEQPEVFSRLKTLLERHVSEARSTPGLKQSDGSAVKTTPDGTQPDGRSNPHPMP